MRCEAPRRSGGICGHEAGAKHADDCTYGHPLDVSIGYAYASSDYARLLKMGNTGCWYTRRHDNGDLKGFRNLEYAFYSLEPGTEYSLDVGRTVIRGTVE